MSATTSTGPLEGMNVAAGVAPSPQTLSVSELRTAMQQHLRRNGALTTLKTQLRGMVLTELMQWQRRAGRVPGTIPSAAPAPQPPRSSQDHTTREADAAVDTTDDAADGIAPSFRTWALCVADAVVENHLRRTQRPMSLSIFSTEAEVTPLGNTGSPTDEEIRLRQLLSMPPGSSYEDPDDDGTAGGTTVATGRPSSRRSVLQLVVEQLLLHGKEEQVRAAGHRHQCSTQTDYQSDAHDETNPLTSLECRLAAVDAKYALTFSQLGRHGDGKSFFTRSEVERRLQVFRNDVHEQLRAEYEQKYKLFEQTKLHEMKEMYEARYRMLIQHKTEELREVERTLVAKADQQQQRSQFAREELERQRLDLERRQREMQETLHGWQVELSAYEASQNELREKLRVAQLQCTKWEELSGERLMEAEAARSREHRRIEDNRRMQSEHAAELRLKDEELTRLRFRIRMLVNSASDRQTHVDAERLADTTSDPTISAQKVNDDIYQMLVRTEELQRHSMDQHRIMQQQQHGLQQRWDATWTAAPPLTTTQAAAAVTAPSSAPSVSVQHQLQPAVEVQLAPTGVGTPTLAPSPLSSAVLKPTVTAEVDPVGTAASPVSLSQAAHPRLLEAPIPSAAASHSSLTTSPTSVTSNKSTGPRDSVSPVPGTLQPAESEGSAVASRPPLPSEGASPHSFSRPTASSPKASPAESSDAVTGAAADLSAGRATDTVSSHTPSHESLPAAQCSGSSSLLALAAKVLTKSRGGKDSETSSRASSASSTASSASASSPKRMPSASDLVGIHQKAREALCDTESITRDALYDEADTAYRGIMWSAKSQLTVLQSQEEHRKLMEASSSEDDERHGGRLGFTDTYAQQQQQAQAAQANLIFRDDSEDNDSVLFGGNSSHSSF